MAYAKFNGVKSKARGKTATFNGVKKRATENQYSSQVQETISEPRSFDEKIYVVDTSNPGYAARMPVTTTRREYVDSVMKQNAPLPGMKGYDDYSAAQLRREMGFGGGYMAYAQKRNESKSSPKTSFAESERQRAIDSLDQKFNVTVDGKTIEITYGQYLDAVAPDMLEEFAGENAYKYKSPFNGYVNTSESATVDTSVPVYRIFGNIKNGQDVSDIMAAYEEKIYGNAEKGIISDYSRAQKANDEAYDNYDSALLKLQMAYLEGEPDSPEEKPVVAKSNKSQEPEEITVAQDESAPPELDTPKGARISYDDEPADIMYESAYDVPDGEYDVPTDGNGKSRVEDAENAFENAKAVYNDSKKAYEKAKEEYERDVYYYEGLKTFMSLSDSDKAVIQNYCREMAYIQYDMIDAALGPLQKYRFGRTGDMPLGDVKKAYSSLKEELENSGLSADEITRMEKTISAYYEETAANATQNLVTNTLEYHDSPLLTGAFNIARIPAALNGGVLAATDTLVIQPLENLGKSEGFKAPVNYNSAATHLKTSTDTVREYTSEEIKVNYGEAASFAYDVLVSVGESVAAGFAGPAAGAVVLGSGAAYDAAKDAHNRGASDEQAWLTGVLAGVYETFFEKVSLGNLQSLQDISSATWKEFLKSAAKSSAVNASEEFFTDAANIITDLAVNREHSEFYLSYQEYAKEHSSDEAWLLALKDTGKRLGLTTLAGAASGGVMSGSFGGYNFASNYTANDIIGSSFVGENGSIDIELANTLIAQGLSSENTDIKRYATSIKDVSKVDAKQLGNLQRMIIAEQGVPSYYVDDNGRIQEESYNTLLTAALSSKDARTLNYAKRLGNRAIDRVSPSEIGVLHNMVSATDRSSFSKSGQTAFDIAMKGAKDKATAATQFRIKYLEGETGAEFTVDNDSELTPSMQEAAYKYGAEAAKTVANGAKTEYNNTYMEADNGRKVHLRDGGERTDGTNTGEQVRVVEEGTGRNQSGQTKGKPRDSEAASLTLGKEVSTASFYIQNGSRTDKIYRIAGGETTAMKNARVKASERGLNVVFFAGGNLTVDGKPARAYISGKNVLIRADDPDFTADQIMEHEIGHDKIAKGEIDLDTVKDRLNSIYGAETVDFICQQYVEAYEGSNLAPEKVFEEMVCDSLGDMNAFDSESEIREAADSFLATTKAVTEASTRAATNPDAVVEGNASSNLYNASNGKYDYSTLINKPDMTITVIDDTIQYPTGKEALKKARVDILKDALSNAAQIGYVNNSNQVFVRVNDIGTNVMLAKNGLKHGLDRRLQANAAATIKAGEILQNAIRINELTPDLETASGAYVLLGAAKNSSNELYIVEFVVNKFDDKIISMDVLYSANAKKESAVQNAPESTGKPLLVTDSTISIAQLLDFAREKFPDVLPESVLRHFGFDSRPEGKIGESALYSHVLPSDRTSKPLTVEQKEIWKRVLKMTPMQIANMQLEDVDPLPKLAGKKPSGVNAENGKESKFYGSAMKSDNVAEDTKRLIKTADDVRYYVGVANTDTLEEANDRLNIGGQSEALRFAALQPGKASAVDVAEGFILLKRYQDKGDFENATRIARKLREIGTSAGQTVQTFSILGRLTPEGMAVYAQKELDAVREEMIRKHSEVWVEQRKDMFSLSAEEMQFIKDNMIAASKLPDGREKNILIAKIASMLEEKLPKKVLRQIQAYTRVSMLLNSKTMLRNVLGNAIMMPMYVVEDFVGAGFDKALAQKTGVRTKGMMHFDKATGKAAAKGVYESFDDFRRHVNTRDIQNDRFEIGGGDAFRWYGKADFKNAKGIKRVKWAGYFLSDMLNAVDRINSFLLDMGDRPFFEFHFTNSINNQLRLNNATEPTADMIRIATTEALQRTWQDDNAYTKAASQIRNMLNGGKSWGIGSIIVPFTKTPTNLTKALIEYSPAGLVKAITYNAHKYSNSLKNAHPDPAVQKAFVDSFAKGVTGTLVMAIAYALANAGLISGGDDDKDKDLAAFEKNIMGIAPYSVTVNGKSYSYDWMQPVGGIFAITADYVQNVKAGNSPKVKGLDTLGTYGKAILNALSAGGNVLFEQSFLQGVSELFGDDGLAGGLISSVANAPTQAISTALSQIAQLADPYVRTSYVYRDTLSTAANKVKAKLPWERKELAPVVDVLGHDVLAYGGNNSFANVFLNPSNIYSETATDAAKEIYRVYEETGDATVIPRVAPYYFEYDDKRYTFTPHERADYQRATGSANERIVNDLKNTYGYMKLSDEDKAKALALVTDYATANAKYEYLAEHDVKYERDSWMIKAAEGVDNGVSEAEYIVAKTVTKGIDEGLPDKNGETYENSKSLLIMEAIYSIPNLSDEQRKYLFESFGVGKRVIGYTRAGVQNTLSKMRAKTY